MSINYSAYGGYDAAQDPRGYNKSERAKEMSKQEEILLKRKREIERKMKEKQSQPAPPSCPPPASNKRNKSASAAANISNKFANDGSFLEQFKRFSQTSVKKEAEDDVLPPTERVQSVAPTLKPQHAAFKEEDSESEKEEDSGTKNHIKKEEDTFPWASEETYDEISSQSKEEQRDWFQDALKRAKEKAKLLTAPAQVSLSDDSEPPAKKRSSRWSSEPSPAPAPAKPPRDGIPVAQAEEECFQAGVCLNIPNNVMSMLGAGQHNEAIQGVFLTKLTRTNPAIVAYARRVFGSTDLTDAQWKQCEEQMKMNVVFQLLQARKAEAERLEQQGRVKYEYDSDEEVEGGTWEHRRRAKEMEDTKQKAEELTRLGEGKHHIGDFLPPEELARFVEKYNALKEGRDPDLSDYREHKLTSDNIGYRMLQSMGWTEGTGLGIDGKGITAPVNQNGRSENKGLGVERPDDLNEDDDEYDAYRKRMMLAYRFRPNPLNNPRRAYY